MTHSPLNRPSPWRADLRSDTVTQPTSLMWEAMRDAPLGDDVFGDDPTTIALQTEIARLLGKESALFVPSGTMANQLAVRALTQPGDEVLAHQRSHLYNYESGGPAALSGVTIRPLDSADGRLTPQALQAAWQDGIDPHFAPTRLVAIENTHNACGGLAMPAPITEAAGKWATSRGLMSHLDGARLWNASAALGTPLSELAAPFTTVSVCFSKGLGAPAGSALAGPQTVIDTARRFRKMFGGAMRQSGVLAAAALYAVQHHRARLPEDHSRARQFFGAIAEFSPVLTPRPVPHSQGTEFSGAELSGPMPTNIVYFNIDPHHPMGALDPRGTPRLLHETKARGVGLTGSKHTLRAVFHLDAGDEALQFAIDTLRALILQ